MKQKVVPWIFVTYFGALLVIQMVITPGFPGSKLIKYVPLVAEFHDVLLGFFYRPYIF